MRLQLDTPAGVVDGTYDDPAELLETVTAHLRQVAALSLRRELLILRVQHGIIDGLPVDVADVELGVAVRIT